MAQRQCRNLSDVASARLTLQLQAEARMQIRRTLEVTVRRDPDGKTVTAECALLGPWGHGATIGEAFRDCLADLAERSSVIMKGRDHLGPALQREAEAIKRWSRAE